MAPKLEVVRGENAGESFKVKMTTRIGRERDNDVVLLDLKSSRHHAEIKLDAGQWLVTDLNSANGTYVNGEPVTSPTPLKHGDRLAFGETDMLFKLPGFESVAAPVAGPPPPTEVPRRGEASGTIPVASAAKRQPSAKTGSSRLVWIVGGLALLLIIIALFVVYMLAGTVSSGESTAGNTPVPTVAEAGQVPEQPAATPTPVRSGPSTDVPGRPEELGLVYEEDYSDSFSGWDDAFDAYTRKVYGNNRYNIEVYASNLVAWGLANRIVADFEIEVDAKLEDGVESDSYGLLFRFQDRDNFYRFDISGDGYYLFSKYVDGQWETLVDWTASNAINPGVGATNVLKVSAFGPNLTLWANGQQLVSLEDDSIDAGNFGFFTGTFSDPYSWVSFDNLKMWTAPNQEITLIPTPTPIGGLAVAAVTPTPTPIPATPTPEAARKESESALAESPIATPTRRPSPTPSPTPVPLPEYASRDQTLGRGEAEATGRIIFPVFDARRGVYDIYAADIADGDNLQLLQESASQPAISPNGAEFAYRSWLPDKRGLFARSLGDSPDNAWGFDLFFESARPQFAPDSQTLMYFSRTGGKEPAIYQVINGVGEVKRRDGAPIQGKSPKWSPDGSQFVYNGCMGSSCGVMLSNVDGSAPVLLTDNPSDTNPEISPDGSTIVFMSERAGNWEIYRMDINGDNLEALTEDPNSDGLPTWSPDGSKIAFVSNRDGTWSVWVMNADGSNKRRQFEIDGELDGIIQHDVANSFGWVEENLVWIP